MFRWEGNIKMDV